MKVALLNFAVFGPGTSWFGFRICILFYIRIIKKKELWRSDRIKF